jgi:hypothetical protein
MYGGRCWRSKYKREDRANDRKLHSEVLEVTEERKKSQTWHLLYDIRIPINPVRRLPATGSTV